MPDKVYIGTGKYEEKPWGQHLRFWVTKRDVDALVDHLSATGKTGLALNVCERKQAGDKGQTHYMVLDTYEPPAKQEAAPTTTARAEQVLTERAGVAAADANQDIPF
jgi:hypothetical protein